MEASIPPPTGNRISDFFRTRFSRIREINAKYRTPRIHTSRAVSLSLLMLRIYLLVLIGILIFKFIVTVITPVTL